MLRILFYKNLKLLFKKKPNRKTYKKKPHKKTYKKKTK